jgi:AGZA family xanthine/uracil permease-like MFS transporter
VPELALVPTVIVFAAYGSHLKFPFRLPTGFVCIGVGLVAVWILKALHCYPLPDPPPLEPAGFYPPHPVNLFGFLSRPEGWRFLSVIVPMSILDTMVSLQILESVKIAGDDYKTRSSLLVNGLATLVASFFGSPFPTSLYFGHMAHKAIGARVGYSIINGVVILLICLTGVISIVSHFVPLEVVSAIVVWFGLVMVAQAFQEVPKAHCLAVGLGLIPMIASWALQLIDLTLRKAGSSLFQGAGLFGQEFSIYGLIALSQGALFVSMIWAAFMALVFDRKFLQAAVWMGAGSLFSLFGLIHAYTLTEHGVENKFGFWAAPTFTLTYALAALFLVGCHYYVKHRPSALMTLDEETL